MPSRLFACDGLLRPQDGPKMAQESPKRGPRGPQDGPKSAQERSKSGPRGAQDALLEPPRGGARIECPPLFEQWGPRRPQEASQTPKKSPKRAPRPPKRAPRGPQECPKRTPREPQDGSKRPPRTSHNNTSTRLGIVSGWAGGDTRSVKNSLFSRALEET